MGWIPKILTGSGGGWILLAAMLGTAAAAGAAGFAGRGLIDAPVIAGAQLATEKAKGETLTCERDNQKARADGNAKVVGELQAQVRRLSGVVQELENKRQARDASKRQFDEALARIAKTSVCGGSAPELAYRGSVQPSAGPAVP